METGTVKWFNNTKGFGFVCPSGGGDDIFVHYSTIQMDGYRTLKAGQKVNYTTTPGPKGLHVSVITPVTEDDDTSA
ncbi:cold shock domain-containing protein CspD [Morganella psychrotolerans]|uniref:Cold shock-like protein CspD n=1 Tax=Morganella psychrotolerans TaxID=368603 RepID=A0A1B8HEE4_9GAMM|nr:cold shock domain-containing protein CspD [Morganella psychrotolerans]OBU07447.1 cold shock domain protein CspD [Morganella psychrotolerans]